MTVITWKLIIKKGNESTILLTFCKAPIYKAFRSPKVTKSAKISKIAENARFESQNPLFIRVSEVENGNETLILLTNFETK